MAHEPEDLPRPRTPRLGQGSAPWMTFDQQQQQRYNQQAAALANQQPQNDLQGRGPTQQQQQPDSRKHRPGEDDSTSVGSFKTCPSDPNMVASLVPRQISDNYEEVSRLQRSRDVSVMSGASEVTLSAKTRGSKSSVQSDGMLRATTVSPVFNSKPR